MSLNKDEVAELTVHARTIGTDPSPDDLVHEAVRRALEENPGASGSTLVEAAKNEMRRMSFDEHNRRRRDAAVRRAAEVVVDTGPLPQHVRRRTRRRILPKGVIPVRTRPESYVVPTGIGDLPGTDSAAMARRLRTELISPVLRGEPLTPEHHAALREAYEDFFQEPPQALWASILTQELQSARRDQLSAQIAVNHRRAGRSGFK